MASERASSTVKGNRFVAILRLASFFPRKWNLPRLTRPRTDRRCPTFSPRCPSCFPYPSLILHESGARSLAPPPRTFFPAASTDDLARGRGTPVPCNSSRVRGCFFCFFLSTRGTEERGGEVERGRTVYPGFREIRAACRRRILGTVRKRRFGVVRAVGLVGALLDSGVRISLGG